MKPQPEPKANRLIKRINRLSLEKTKSPFAIKSIKREATGLIKSDSRRAYMALGMLACLEGEIGEMRDYHENALRISSDYSTNFNYATSLSNNGFFQEAQKYALIAHEKEPSDIDCLSLIIKDNVAKGRFREAFDWLEKFKKVFPDKEVGVESFVSSSIVFLDKNNISDDDVEHIQNIAITLLHQRELYRSEITCRFLQDEDSEWLNFVIKVELLPTEVVDLSVELAEKLARENLPAHVTSCVDVMYTSLN